jgi:hypothetical protein
MAYTTINITPSLRFGRGRVMPVQCRKADSCRVFEKQIHGACRATLLYQVASTKVQERRRLETMAKLARYTRSFWPSGRRVPPGAVRMSARLRSRHRPSPGLRRSLRSLNLFAKKMQAFSITQRLRKPGAPFFDIPNLEPAHPGARPDEKENSGKPI